MGSTAPIEEKMIKYSIGWFGHVFRRPAGKHPIRGVVQIKGSPIFTGKGHK